MADDVRNTIRISAVLKADATARAGNPPYTVTLVIKIPSQSGETKGEVVSFAYDGDHDGLRELMDELKKDRTVELVAELTTTTTLQATFVRVQRIDYAIPDPVTILPGA